MLTRFARGNNRKTSLRYDLLFWVWICSSLATACFTVVQVYSDYSREVSEAVSQLDTIKLAHAEPMAASLWDLNYRLAKIQVDSIFKLPHVSYVQLSSKEQTISRGSWIENNPGGTLDLDIGFNQNILGRLQIQIDFAEIRYGYLWKVGEIFLLQSIKTFIVCWILLFIFSKLVVRHIEKLTNFIENFDIDDQNHLALNRAPRDDEFSAVVDKINDLKGRLYSANKAIKDMNENLESQVQKRTQELEAARAQSIQSSKLAALGELAGGIAHEINNPLAVISSSISALEKARSRGQMNELFMEKICAKVKGTVERISQIIKGLMAISREGSSPERKNVDLELILDTVVDLCGSRIKKEGVELRVEKTAASELMINCNQVLLSQVILNLLRNASDAIKSAKKSDGWISIEVSHQDDFCCIKVIDNGPGVPPEYQEKIFDPFFTLKDVGQGTGLGLSVSLGIVKDIGGSLDLDLKSENTCFRIYLPLVESKKTAKGG